MLGSLTIRLVGIALVLCGGQVADAALLVDWGGDYVSSYQQFSGSPTSTAGVTTYLYSTTAAKSPASGYTGPEFYGAFSLTNSSGTGTPAFNSLDRFGVANSGVADQIRIGAVAPTGETVTMRGLVFFQKEDFLGGGNAGPVTLDNASSFSLNVVSSGGSSRQFKMAVYAFVDGSWNWYLSQATGAGAAALNITGADASLWGLYSINGSTSPLDSAPSAAAYTVSGSTFADIGAVGYYFNYTSSIGTNTTIYVDSFEFNGVSVPEPHAILLGLTALGFVGFHKLRRFRQKVTA